MHSRQKRRHQRCAAHSVWIIPYFSRKLFPILCLCFPHWKLFFRSQDGYKNFERKSNEILGFAFEKSSVVEYSLAMQTQDGKNVLYCHRLSGDAFLLNDCWKNWLSILENQNFIAPKEQEEDPLAGLWSDDEDMEMSDFLDMDTCDVECMIDDLKEPSFQLNTAMLLAWNLQNSQNLEVMSNYAQLLFNTA